MGIGRITNGIYRNSLLVSQTSSAFLTTLTRFSIAGVTV